MKFCYINSITFRDLFTLYGNDNVKKIKGKIGEYHKSIISLSGLKEKSLNEALEYPLHQINEQFLEKILIPFNSYNKYKFINKVLKFCPSCLNNKYHSTLHQFSFIQQCPFHKIKLLTKCPRCQKSFPYSLNDSPMQINYSCSCGFVFSPNNKSVKPKFSPYIVDNNVRKWINLTPIEISKINNIQIFDEEDLASEFEEVEFKYDISFIFNSISVQNNAVHIGVNHDLLDRRLVRERLRKNSFLKTIESYQNYFEKTDIKYSYQQADKIFTSIARHLRKTILKKHICCIKEFTRYKKELTEEEICPFAVAYVFWRSRLQGFKTSQDVDNSYGYAFFKDDCDTYGYPVFSYKFYRWLDALERENIVLPESISSSRNTYLWIINHFLYELIMAEFYRCLDYGLSWRDNQIKNYNINSIYSFKYLPKFLIKKDANDYFCVKEDKTAIKELYERIKNTSCINANIKSKRNRKKVKSQYVKPNPLDKLFERMNKR